MEAKWTDDYAMPALLGKRQGWTAAERLDCAFRDLRGMEFFMGSGTQNIVGALKGMDAPELNEESRVRANLWKILELSVAEAVKELEGVKP